LYLSVIYDIIQKVIFMKEKCEKLFQKGKIGYTLFLIIVILLSLAVTALIILLKAGTFSVIKTAVCFVLVDICLIIARKVYYNSAYYVEKNGENLVFYTENGLKEKSVTDCKRMLKFSSEFFLFFNDGMIRLCRFHKCRDAVSFISKDIFPNIK